MTTAAEQYKDVWQVKDPGPTPSTVRLGVLALLVAAAVALLGIVLHLVHISDTRALFLDTYPPLTPSQVRNATALAVVLQCVQSLVTAAVLAVFAFLARPGRQWARVLGTVIVALGIAITLPNALDPASADGAVHAWLLIAFAAVGVVLLWLPPSMPWFKPREVVGFGAVDL